MKTHFFLLLCLQLGCRAAEPPADLGQLISLALARQHATPAALSRLEHLARKEAAPQRFAPYAEQIDAALSAGPRAAHGAIRVLYALGAGRDRGSACGATPTAPCGLFYADWLPRLAAAARSGTVADRVQSLRDLLSIAFYIQYRTRRLDLSPLIALYDEALASPTPRIAEVGREMRDSLQAHLDHTPVDPALQTQVEEAARSAPGTDLQTALLARLLTWARARQVWQATPASVDGSDVIRGLIACTPCRQDPAGRLALLGIAQGLRATPRSAGHIVAAYRLAQRCAPAQAGDPFVPVPADDVRLAEFILGDAELHHRQVLNQIAQARDALHVQPPAEALRQLPGRAGSTPALDVIQQARRAWLGGPAD